MSKIALIFLIYVTGFPVFFRDKRAEFLRASALHAFLIDRLRVIFGKRKDEITLCLGNGEDLRVLPSGLGDARRHGIAVFVKHSRSVLRAGKQPGFGGSGIEPVFQKSRHKPGQDREQRHRIPRVEGLSAQKPREQPACAEQKGDRREDVYPAAALFPHGPAGGLWPLP